MIRYVEPDQLSRLLDFLAQGALGVKIAGHALAYGVQPFSEYWMQRDQAGRVLSAIGRLDSILTLCAHPALYARPDLCAELETFCRMLPGIRRVLFPKDLPIPFKPGREFLWMEQEKMSNCVVLDTERDKSLLSSPSVSALYALLSVCREGAVELPSRSDFLVDMSHRFRHGVARCWGIPGENGYRAAVFTTAETMSHALIGGVVTHPEDRGQGLATRLMGEACRTLSREEKKQQLFCLPSARPFYEQLGFSVGGYWAEAEIIENT